MTLIPSISFFNPNFKENKQMIEGAATGIADFGLSQVFIMKKNQIQAGATVSKKGERKFIAGFFVSTVFGQLLTNYNSTTATTSATVLSIGIETGLRPFLTKSKPTLCLLGLISAREALYWGGLKLTNELTKTKESNGYESFASQLIFSGILANIFDTFAGQCSRHEFSTREFLTDVIKKPSYYAMTYLKSLPSRITGCVLTPWLATQLICNERSQFQILLNQLCTKK
jgi:hypothetical protein